jgi:hypothetical protein
MGSIVGYLSYNGVSAAADLSASQYRAVKWDSTERRIAAITNANAERPIGILQDDPDAANKPADVAAFGMCRAQLGGTVTFGDKLACNNSGQLVTDAEVTGGGAVDLHHIAEALEAGVSGDTVDVFLFNSDRIGAE